MILLRIITVPFIFCIHFLFFTYEALRRCYFFVRYGGEWITYCKANEKKTIKDIYDSLNKIEK